MGMTKPNPLLGGLLALASEEGRLKDACKIIPRKHVNRGKTFKPKESWKERKARLKRERAAKRKK